MQNELKVQGFAGPPKGPPAHVSHVTHCPHTEWAWPQEGINVMRQCKVDITMVRCLLRAH